MSSDQVGVSDAAIATAKSSSKRSLDEEKDLKAEDPESQESSTVDNNTAENPPKRAKVEASTESEEVTSAKENPLSPSTTRSSTTNNEKDQNTNGDNGADTTGGNHIHNSTDTDAMKIGIDPSAEESSSLSTSSSSRRETTTSCGVSTTPASDDAAADAAPNASPPLPSPALTRSRALSTDKKKRKGDTLDTVGEDGGDSKVVSAASNERWRGKTVIASF